MRHGLASPGMVGSGWDWTHWFRWARHAVAGSGLERMLWNRTVGYGRDGSAIVRSASVWTGLDAQERHGAALFAEVMLGWVSKRLARYGRPGRVGYASAGW